MLNSIRHPHGLIIQLANDEVAAAVRAEFGDLLESLCDLHTGWCLGE